MIAQQTFIPEIFSKRQKWERKQVLSLLPGSREHLALKKPCILCQNMGAHAQLFTLYCQKYEKTGQEIRLPCSQERRKEQHRQMRGTIIPIRGCAHLRHPGLDNPLSSEVAGGGGQCWVAELGAGLGARGGRRFCSAAAAAVVPGRIRPRHCRPDAGHHGPGPAPVGGRVWQPPAPLGCNGQALFAGLLPQACRCSRGQGEHLARPWCGA